MFQTAKLTEIDPAQGTEPAVLNRCSVLEYKMYYLICFYSMSPTEQIVKLHFVFLARAFCCFPGL